MTRLMLMTFFGEKRWEKGVHPHESPKVMTVPLIVLAALSVLGGVLLLGRLDRRVPRAGGRGGRAPPPAVPPIVMTLVVVAVVAVGVATAWLRWAAARCPRTAPQRVSVFTRAARADLYGDAINEALFMRPGDRFVGDLVTFDNAGVDGAVNGTAAAFGGMSGRMRRWQNGFVRSYALSVLVGAVVVLVAMLAVNLGMSSTDCSLRSPPRWSRARGWCRCELPWLTVIAVPLVGSVVVALLPARLGGALAKQVAFGVSLLTLGIAAAVGARLRRRAAGFQYTEEHEWIAAFGAHYALGVDGIGLTLVLLTAILTPVVILASWDDGDAGRWGVNAFFAWMLALEGLAIGVFAATDVFLFYVLFEATLIPIYFLIGGFGGPGAPTPR